MAPENTPQMILEEKWRYCVLENGETAEWLCCCEVVQLAQCLKLQHCVAVRQTNRRPHVLNMLDQNAKCEHETPGTSSILKINAISIYEKEKKYENIRIWMAM